MTNDDAAGSTELRRDETAIVGRWAVENGRVVPDPAARRVETLVERSLRKLAASTDGWSGLYVDPRDGRLWELRYEQSEEHGGGAPSLFLISETDAADRYGWRGGPAK